MAEPVVTLGDGADHPGEIVSSCERHYANNGQLIAREGDLFLCELHGLQPIVLEVSDKVEIEGAMAARNGSVCACGAKIIAIATSPTV